MKLKSMVRQMLHAPIWPRVFMVTPERFSIPGLAAKTCLAEVASPAHSAREHYGQSG
jgi:hypothetical protein